MFERPVLAILEEHLSSITARSLLQRCTQAMGVRAEELDARHLPDLVQRLEMGVLMFAPRDQQKPIMERIRSLGSAPVPSNTVVPVEAEADVAAARTSARSLAIQLGSSSFVAQKIATAVSELARNIILYAGSGQVELAVSDTPARRLRIVATDRGPGIANLDHVLSGRYRSKTGLGRGLLSLRRMADFFDVETGPGRTVIRVEFEL